MSHELTSSDSYRPLANNDRIKGYQDFVKLARVSRVPWFFADASIKFFNRASSEIDSPNRGNDIRTLKEAQRVVAANSLFGIIFPRDIQNAYGIQYGTSVSLVKHADEEKTEGAMDRALAGYLSLHEYEALVAPPYTRSGRMLYQAKRLVTRRVTLDDLQYVVNHIEEHFSNPDNRAEVFRLLQSLRSRNR